MTISKERFEYISKQTAFNLDAEFGLSARTKVGWITKYATALIKAIESESAAVGYEWVDPVSGMKISFNEPDEYPEVFHIHPLITLPLIGD